MEHLAQSAFAQSPAAAGLDLATEIIVVCMNIPDIAEYQGTRATLEAEGVIPAGTKWPDGFDQISWDDGKFSYWMRRERPEGVKGSRKQFLNVDWWMLRCDPLHAKSIEARIIERKHKDLAEAIYHQSAKGQAEYSARCERYWAAKRDQKFQAFKALIPGLVEPAPGRRPKNAEQSQGASA